MALRFPFAGALGPEAYLPGPGLATHLIPLALWGVGVCHFGASLLTTREFLPPNAEQVALNWALALVWSVGMACWTLLRVRGNASSASGAGLVLASYGLAARVWIELGAYYGAGAIERDQAGPLLETVLTGGRWLALGAFAFGLASTAACLIADRRQDGRDRRLG